MWHLGEDGLQQQLVDKKAILAVLNCFRSVPQSQTRHSLSEMLFTNATGQSKP